MSWLSHQIVAANFNVAYLGLDPVEAGSHGIMIIEIGAGLTVMAAMISIYLNVASGGGLLDGQRGRSFPSFKSYRIAACGKRSTTIGKTKGRLSVAFQTLAHQLGGILDPTAAGDLPIHSPLHQVTEKRPIDFVEKLTPRCTAFLDVSSRLVVMN